MIILRKAGDRGLSTTEWLNSYHTFSFADYNDPNWRNYAHLRVINEDYIKSNSGFDMHPHRNMEIITYIVSGALKHQDSMGNSLIIRPSEIQRMSAGSGVLHSEYNYSKTQNLHLLQIWIVPEKKELEPSYEQKKIEKQLNQLLLIGSNHPTNQAIKIHQNINLYVGFLEKDRTLVHSLNYSKTWLQLIKGHTQVNNLELHAGDGVGIYEETKLTIHSLEESEFLLFEMI